MATSLTYPPVEERIAPGGISSSATINSALEELRDDFQRFSEETQQRLERVQLLSDLETGSLAGIGALVTDLVQQLGAMSSGRLPISFRFLGGAASWVSAQMEPTMWHELYGVVTPPVASQRSLVYESAGMRQDLVLRLATGANSPPDGSLWLYTLDAESYRGGYWVVPIPTGDASRWLRIRIGLATGGFDEMANLCYFQILPPGVYRLHQASVVSATGQTTTIDLSGAPWTAQWVSDLLLHWNPMRTGAVSGVDVMLERAVSSAAASVSAFAIGQFDLRSLRFERQGDLILTVQPARQPQRVDAWRLGSDTNVSLELLPNGAKLTLRREREWFAPILKGVTFWW